MPLNTTTRRLAALTALLTISIGGNGLLAAPTEPASSFVSITPTRVLDTRSNLGLNGPFESPTSRTLQLTGAIPTSTGTKTVIPTTATGVVLNITAVQPQASGFISIRPDGTPGPPQTSNLNFTTGDVIANAVTVALPTTGTIEITYNAFDTPGPTTNILIDINGYYTPTTTTNGTPGPPGPAGPQGPQGPQGAPGPQAPSCQAILLWGPPQCDTTTIGVGTQPQGVAFDGTHIWVTNRGAGSVSKIDPATNTVVDYGVGAQPIGVAFDGFHIWTANIGTSPGTVSKVDIATGGGFDVNVGANPVAVAFDGTNIWVTNSGDDPGTVWKIDPDTGNRVGDPIDVGTQPQGVAFDGTHIWVANGGDDTVSKIDPTESDPTKAEVATVNVGSGPVAVAFDGTHIWVANSGTTPGTVSKINPTTNTVVGDPIDVGTSPQGVAFDGTHIWVANGGSDNVSKINPTTNSVVDTVDVGKFPRAVAFDGTNIWVANFTSNTVSKLVPG